MDVVMNFESPAKEDLDQVVAALQEKFPHWIFERKESFVLYRKDDPVKRQAHTSYTAKVYITSTGDE